MSRAAPPGRGPSGASSALPSGLDEIYRHHVGFVWRSLRRLGIDAAAAEDLVHEVFVVVHRRLPEYDGRASMTSWLYGIARGIAANHRRTHGRTQRRLEVVGRMPVAAPIDAHERMEIDEGLALVDRFLAGLDADKREVFMLAELEGMRGPEIAEAVGVPVDTVYSRLREARRRFEQAVARWQAVARREQQRPGGVS
jgi:RNA polymerase sigma-70 factor, ECF subfamily